MLGFNKKTTRRRRLTFIVFSALIFVSFFLLPKASWPKNLEFLRLWSVASFCIALVTGVIALIKLVTRKKNKYVFIAAAFLGVALLEGYSLFTSLSGTALLWMLSAILLSGYLLLSLKTWREGEGEQKGLRPRVYISGAVSAFLIITLVTLLPNYDPYNSIGIFGRPIELPAVLLFASAILGYYKKGYWEFKYFEYWLVVLVLSVLFVSLGISLSFDYFDSMFF